MKEIKKFQNKVQFFFRPIKMRNRKFGKGTLDESLDEVELIENTKNFDRIYNETKVTPFESNISVFLGYFSIIMLLNFFFFNYSFYWSVIYTVVALAILFVSILILAFAFEILANFESLIGFGLFSCLLVSIVILIYPKILY
jgi:hypothetical protein